MRTYGPLFLAATLAMTVFSAQAQPDVEMTTKLKTLYPKTTFSQINKTEIPGLTEVVMGKNIAYVDPTGRYFLFGKLYDMQTQQDLTQSRMEELNKIDVSQLDKKLAFKRVNGNGSRVMHLFSDPDCPFCKRVETALAELKDVTIYTYMMPLVSIHPEAHAKSVSVWCAKDRAVAWNDMMLKNKDPQPAKCEHPVDKVLALAQSMGVSGTPTMFTEDGRRMQGARDAAAMNAWLDGAASKTAARKE